MTTSPLSSVRVWVTDLDVWDNLALAVEGHDTFHDVKLRALAHAVGGTPDPDTFEVKFRGALISDEGRTLAEAGVPERGPMIVQPAGRRPVS